MGVMKTINVGRAMGGARLDPSAVTQWFFDRPKVANAVDKMNLRYLSRAGGYTRRVAQSSIKRKGHARAMPKMVTKRGTTSKAFTRWYQEMMERPASPPGQPPFTHTGFLKRDIVYSFDPTTKSAVVGPHRVPWLNRLHEYGGTLPMQIVSRKGASWLQRVGTRVPSGAQVIGSRTARYPARPFMRPALQKALRMLPAFARNSIYAT